MQSKATTVADYLKSLPTDRRAIVEALRSAMKKHLPKEIEEGMNYGMIGWYVPHRIYPNGYHCNPKQPLPYAGLASQKNYVSLYLFWTYENSEAEKWLRAEWTKGGRKLDMGKCCIRVKSLDEVPLDVVAEAVKRMPYDAFVSWYVSMLDPRTGKAKSMREKPAAKATAKAKPAAKAGKSAAKAPAAKKATAKKTAAKKSK